MKIIYVHTTGLILILLCTGTCTTPYHQNGACTHSLCRLQTQLNFSKQKLQQQQQQQTTMYVECNERRRNNKLKITIATIINSIHFGNLKITF